MTTVRFTRNYITQQELRKAYQALHHATPFPDREYDAVLLIDDNLFLSWACPRVDSDLSGEPSIGWHVIARAGELDWPPLRPEEECWRNLLAAYPVPAARPGDEDKVRMYGMSMAEWHYQQLRQQFLSDAHTPAGYARNKTDVNFSPLVRDWNVTARQLADFLDANRPPLLTSEQRVMHQGARLVELEAETERTKNRLSRLVRNAAHEQREQSGRLRYGFKSDAARWTARSRSTIDQWLSEGGPSEPAIYDEHGDAFPKDTYADLAGITRTDDGTGGGTDAPGASAGTDH